MDDDEKIMGLKKAYADVILNISKEVSTRVTASERRAVRCQHEMKVAKEESLRMLLRMKQMMDSKISEGEAITSNQQKKIVELEAQLQEAEDIVRDLRDEVAQAQAELENVKNGDNSLRENEIPSDITGFYYHPSLQDRCNIPSGAKIPCLYQRQVCRVCHNKLDCACTLYMQNRDFLPSIILRGSKDSTSYRNGRTQRIRACERNVLGQEIRLSGTTAEEEKKNQKEDKDMLQEPLSYTANVEFVSSQSFLCKRKRAARQRKPVREASIEEGGACLVETPSMEKDVLNPITTEDSEIERDPVEYPDPTGLNRSERERGIKYTFQRKRKRSANEASDKQGEDGKNLEKSKNNPLMESTREGRRMAQVARQLLSLSERKWWD